MAVTIARQSSLITRVVQARAPGTCGELVQGQFDGGLDFLITFPVDLWSQVEVEVDRASPLVKVFPPSKIKTQMAVRRTLDFLGQPTIGAKVFVSSTLPEGKGMASSTADIVAACKATAGALGRSLSGDEISRIAISIEPSDGIMYPGVVCYNHRQGGLLKRLGYLPLMEILVVDLGGEVDTLEFNKVPKNYFPCELSEIRRAYELVARGIQEQDPALIGMAATISARVNQRLLYKPHLEAIIEVAEAAGAYGVSVAHSGTVVGLLFGRDAGNAISRTEQAIRTTFNPALNMFRTRSISVW